jgi:pyruvate-formate lyase
MEGVSWNPASLRDSKAWRGFEPGRWQAAIDVRDFIVNNVTPYTGNESFLVGPSARTTSVWEKLQPYFTEERRNGVLDVDAATPSTVLAHGPVTLIGTTRLSLACRPTSRSAARSFRLAGCVWWSLD